MNFGPETMRGAPAIAPRGRVDFRLARNVVVREYRRGRLSRDEVCDAHPELVRAARCVGKPSKIDCPICEQSKVMMVSYAFGTRLPPSGRCIDSDAELVKLSRRPGDISCYVVEVCPECSWNHLALLYPLSGSVASG
jgi:hypothetical protein